ncbi:PadR family transcriptional regulator [Mycolicibacterium mageritense]|uniref:PadR family transcriptional regulator n=1 Tax=Mycolicibacterium mageritense TaxID=53462 RepID=UPI0011D3D3A1|nr:PadR family transcriptional regulator [Mycolicibacterium mageritense]TXI63602.1 MAG: PadR family transcriptional regulator [Mycolicibacterium mageritense]
MSLRHALLAVLTAEPMTGYDLIKYFDGTVATFWSAPHSQIYPELRRMEEAGLITAEVASRGERAQKRVYSITEGGVKALENWLSDVEVANPGRDAIRLRAAHFEFSSYAVARRQLTEHLAMYEERLGRLQRMLGDLDDRTVPLLRRRLEQRPADEHEAIIAFKKFAFSGQIAQAEAEISWAQQGLAMLDDLEARRIPLWGSDSDATSAGH